ncbi:MAG TPA: rhodanese-like domain-containing protein [Candidatus Sulfopaludibacter sp.]|jgi:glyoxylase-like metal-dependent hydrolase (beta-lactamase superfamily II)/rhodanese-related sulfurtransferase|nr:rhodanese-like domain-containing protein [Candidatus Sulfopaludibacter sp.]
MYFQQFYLGCLSHASYLIGSGGIAAVVDPQRDVGIYIEDAVRQGLEIRYVIETHLHADFISGHQELAAFTGAKIYLGAQAGAAFPHVPVHDGDELTFGDCLLRFLETPGHTLESISIVVTDTASSPEPYAVLTGDTLFIGDVGRPDLAPGHTPQQLAGLLYDSLQTKLLSLPDSVLVYPAHGAGSLCGRQMSSERSSTIGQQRAENFALKAKNRDEFVTLLTADLPERPGYFAADAEMNRSGPTPLADLPVPDGLSPQAVLEVQRAGGVVLDTRPSGEFGAGHIPGAIQIGMTGQFASWAGRVIGLDQRIVIVAEDRDAALEARTRLARVGMENVAGYLDDGMAAWFREGLAAAEVPQVTVQDVHREMEHLQIVDVRQPGEWEQGHVEKAMLKPLPKLTAMLADLDRSRPVAVHCKSGYRSSIATSLLKREGFENVANVIGGFDAWKACGLPSV